LLNGSILPSSAEAGFVSASLLLFAQLRSGIERAFFGVRGGGVGSLFSDCARPRLEGSDVDDWPSTRRIDGPTAPAGAPAR
jgi:hypothetical protein